MEDSTSIKQDISSMKQDISNMKEDIASIKNKVSSNQDDASSFIHGYDEGSSEEGVTWEDRLKAQLEELRKPIPNDPIHKCGEDLVARIITQPAQVFEIADQHLHTYPFKDVEDCWIRLYADASIAKAIHLILENTAKVWQLSLESGPSNHVKIDMHWVDNVIKILDMALILTEAPLREDMVHSILYSLEDYVDDEYRNCDDEVSFSPKGIYRQSGHKFHTSSYRPPAISKPIIKSDMTFSQFEVFMRHATPHVITNALNHWPAFHQKPWNDVRWWSLRTFNGTRLVPVELGRSYTDADWGQKIMTFNQFLDDYILNDNPPTIGYLAQHRLFKQIPYFRGDFAIPDFCYTTPPPPQPGTPLHGKGLTQTGDPTAVVWFGPAGTISPLHTDPYHNILCQVVGKKYVRLYPPQCTESLYPRGVETGGVDMSNTSSVPYEMVEMDIGEHDDEFPLFRGAEYVEAILEEGDSLYIPIGWWHYVRSLTVSISVNFWWN